MWRIFICSLLLTFAGGNSLVSAANRPNVLFVVIDDLNDWVGCLRGHPQAHTPNLDRLAASGTLFANAHVQAPLCNPSRTSVLTGLRPSTTGIYGLAPGFRNAPAACNCVSLPQAFARKGYLTAGFGKVYHDGSIPPRLRTNEMQVWGPSPGMPLPKKKLVETPAPMKLMDWGVFPEHDGLQPDSMTASNALAQLHAWPKGRPFFLAVGFRLPHVPCFASQKWFDLIPEHPILPACKAGDRDDTPFFSWYLHWKEPEPRLSWLKKANQWEPLVRAYLASTAFMDSQLGWVLDGLDRAGLRSNTIVVLWSDNGWHIGQKDITGKNTLWEPSTRVPLIFSGPGILKGKCLEAVELLDIYPTLAELCGLESPPALEGHSLVPQLKDPKTPREWPAITTHNQDNHSVRNERWRYIRYANGTEELYDLRADPLEWTNLASKAECRGTMEQMAKWLPGTNLPPAEVNAPRVLSKSDGGWLWEGKPVIDSELEW